MAQKQKGDGGAALARLKKDLAAGTFSRLYIFHGDETYLRDFYLGKLREKLLGGGGEAFNLHTIQARDFDPRTLEEKVDCLPMLGEHTLVLVRDYDLFKASEADRGELMRIFRQLPDYCCVVFVYDLIAYKPDSRTKLAASLREHGQEVEFLRQERGDLVDWICRHFRALGKEIARDQADYMIFLCGDLMNALNGEIEKVGAYAKGRRIRREDIDAVATPQLDAVVFRMTDAIGEGNFDRAAKVLGELFQKQEPPIRILYSLGVQVRQLYCARLALERRLGSDYLIQTAGVRPFAADRLMRSARRFSLPWCRRSAVRCAQTDLAMKSGGGDGEALLTQLLLELATPAKGSAG